MANVVNENSDDFFKNNYCYALSSSYNPTHLSPSDTGIADSGSSGINFASDAPVANLDRRAPTVGVQGFPEKSVASVTLASAPSPLANLIEKPLTPVVPFPHQYPSQEFQAIDNAGHACAVTFVYAAAQAVALAAQTARPLFNPQSLDLLSIRALVGFYHACVGFPVKQTWLDAVKAGNIDSFDGLTFSNVSRYCPDADETILGHLSQQRQNVRLTKPRPAARILTPFVHHQRSLQPLKSTSPSIPSASSTRTTPAASPSMPDQATSMP